MWQGEEAGKVLTQMRKYSVAWHGSDAERMQRGSDRGREERGKEDFWEEATGPELQAEL